jgi:hypothetical protein
MIPLSAVVGRWYLCDDGWLGDLTLSELDDGEVEGVFFSDRFDDEYEVVVEIGGDLGQEITLAIQDFNWLPEQRFAGRLFTKGNGAIAGASDWNGTPYGFFAARTPWTALGDYRPGNVVPKDFAGSWNAQLDGVPATLRLDLADDGRTLTGTCEGRGVPEGLRVAAMPDAAVPHRLALTVTAGDGQPWATLDGLLNSRPKNAMSGTMITADGPRGFYLIRYA